MTDTVLVVEDDPGIAELEQGRLAEAGYRVRVANTAEAALDHLRRGGIDLMLLDYRLPGGVDGLDVYARVRASGFDPPVILVTGFSSEATVIRALRAGVRDFVTKSPEYLDYLPEAVGRVLRQVRTEQRLAESEARLAGVIASAKDAIIVADPDRRINLFNQAAEWMFRCRAADAVGKPLTRFIPDEAAPPGGPADTAADSFSHRLRAGTRGRRADGEEFPLEASVSRVVVAGRKLYTVVVRDVTDRERAERALRASEERFRLVTQATREVVRDWDLAAGTIWLNDTFHEQFGFPPDGPRTGDWWADQVHPDDRDRVVGGLRAVIDGGGEHWTDEYRHARADGSFAHVYDRGYVVRDAAGRPVRMIGAMADVTEQKRLEAQYLHAQRMETVGTLAGGVAHDFNNLLTVINGYSELLLETAGPTDPTRTLVLEVRQAGERAAALTRQLLTFSRKQSVALRVFDLNKLVADVSRMLARLIGGHVELETQLDAAALYIRADPGQVEQVVVNLAVNARDAMPNGGWLTIITRVENLDETAARRQGAARPGSYVVLAVTDTGQGMDATTMARAFEPFFTTKEIGKGTGLGLATVHGIVTQAGGHINVQSQPGRGTTFSVYLPRADGAEGSGITAAGYRVPRGTETVLLVEDEDGVRALARVALQAYGYTVLEARSGEEAEQLAGWHDGPIDGLVTDVVMPRMSGRELAERLTAVRPGLRVLFLSGYTDDAILQSALTRPGTGFLQKPFTPMTLARKVRDVFDGKGNAVAQ